MKIYYSTKFEKEYKKLPKKIKSVAEKKEKLFRKDPYSTQLKIHKLTVLVYDRGRGDYIEKMFYCYNDTTDKIINLQSKLKISHSQTRECRKIAEVNGRLCVQDKCKIISDMEFCVNACQNEAFINIHCDDKDSQLDALRKDLYSTVEKNCKELSN